MKKILSFLFAVVLTVSAMAQDYMYICTDTTYRTVALANVGVMPFSEDELQITIAGVTYNLADIDSIVFTQPTLEPLPTGNIQIVWNGESAKVTIPSGITGVSCTSGTSADVILVSTNVADELTYELSGSTTNGSLTYTGDYKCTFLLNNVSLKSTTKGAIDIECGKRINLEIADGTVNTLADAAGGAQKASLHCKGHLEVLGAGTLNVEGYSKHAIHTKEYMQLKKTFTGAINITASANDGIHAGQYFQMNNGTLNISGCAGDGIQAEITDDATDESNGQVIIKGGSISINCTAADVKAIASDSLITIEAGEINITTSGAADKGLKSKTDIVITGGNITINQSGDKLVTSDDVSYSTAIKADGNITISGGKVTIVSTADGGRGLKADGNIYVTEGTTDITINGAGGTYKLGESSTPSTTKSYVVYVALPSSSTMGGGGGGSKQYWTTITLYKADGTQVAALSATKTVNNTTFYYYDFKSASSDSYYFASADYTGQRGTYAIKSSTFTAPSSGSDVYYQINSSYTEASSTRTFTLNDVTSSYSGGTVTADGEDYAAHGINSDKNVYISGGTIIIRHSGAMSKSIKCDSAFVFSAGSIESYPSGATQVINKDAKYCLAVKAYNIQMTGGSLKVTATGAGSRGMSADADIVISGGDYSYVGSGAGNTYTNSSNTTDGYGACGLKSDGNMQLLGGTQSISCTAKGGKGIKSCGTLVIGTTSAGPTLTVKTSGSYIASSSGSGSGMGPGGGGGGGNDSYIGDPKGIKVMGAVTINGGTISISTTGQGGEGLESKSTITINGGTLESSTYDDAINAASKITINGGYIYAHATNNDGIDSNGQGFEFNGGVTMASGTSSPEEGFDCDQNTFAINGGILIGTGGATSSPTTLKQAYASTSASITSGKYIAVKKSDGTVLFAYKCPNTLSSARILLSSPDFTSGTSMTLVYGATAVSNPTETAFGGVFTKGGTLTGGSTTSFTPSTSGGGSGGGGGW